MPHDRVPLSPRAHVTVNPKEQDRDIRRAVEQVNERLVRTYSVEDIEKINLDFDHIPGRFIRETTQSIPDASITPVIWTGEDFDAYAYLFPPASGVLFLIGGVYLIRAEVGWTSNATGRRILQVWQNALPKANNIMPAGVTAPSLHTQEITTFLSIQTGDGLDIRVFQNSGGPLDINECRLEVMRVSPSAEVRAGAEEIARGYEK